MFIRIASIACIVLTAANAAPTPSSSARPSIVDGCYTSKSCFALPPSCIKSNPDGCKVIASIAVEANDTYVFEMESKGAGWIGVGLSEDARMGDDAVIECVRETSDVAAHVSWTTPRPNLSSKRVPEAQHQIELLDSSATGDGKLYCKVRRDTVGVVYNKLFDLKNDVYHLLLVAGSGAGDTFHDIAYGSSAFKAQLSDVHGYEQ